MFSWSFLVYSWFCFLDFSCFSCVVLVFFLFYLGCSWFFYSFSEFFPHFLMFYKKKLRTCD